MTDFDPQADRDAPEEDGPSTAQSAADEADIASALRRLATVVADVDDVQDVLGQIASFAHTSVPGAESVGVTLVHPSIGAKKALAWAVTDDIAQQIDRLQYEVCEEGPCLTAMQTGRALTSGSLGSDARWPRFGGRVARLGVHSALALPLLLRDDAVGAINVYARERDVFGEHAVRLGERFAGPAAVSVHNARMLHAARDQAAQLQTAMRTRAVIDQAIGIVRSRAGGTAEEAFDRLRKISQAENVKLSVVATRMVDEAVRRAHARHSQS